MSADLEKLLAAENVRGPWFLEGRWEDGMSRLGGWLSFGSADKAHFPLFELTPICGSPEDILASARLIAMAPDLARENIALTADNAALRAKAEKLAEAVKALGAMPEGYCFCSKERVGDESKNHEPECADLRAAIWEAGNA